MRNIIIYICLLIFCFNPAKAVGDYPNIDYLNTKVAEYTYDLKFGHKMGYLACRLKVIIDKKPKDPNNENSTDLMDLTLSYSDFHCSYEDKEHQQIVKGELQASRIDVFTFKATIDKYGNPMSSNLKEKIKELEGKGFSQKRFSAVRLGPVIGCTWFCVFPRLSDIDVSQLIEYDTRNWDALGTDFIINALDSMNTGSRLRIYQDQENRKKNIVVLWSETTIKIISKKYGGDKDIADNIKLEFHYDYAKKAVTKGIYLHETVFNDNEEKNPAFFEAVMKE